MHLGLTPWDFSDASARSLQRQAVWAEAMGYESFWLPENHFNERAIPDPLMLLAAVAAATSRIRLATTSYLLTLRHPLQAAEQVAVLDNMSEGRVLLGVGRGFAPDMLRAFNVEPKDKRRVFESSLHIMRTAWAGEAVPVGDGASVVLDPLPVQRPHPPIWVAAFGPKALTQAGRLGLPYLASPVETLDVLERNYAVHRDAAPQPVAEVPLMRTVYVAGSAREAVRVKEALTKLPVPRAEGVPCVDDWAVVGDAAEVRDRLREYRERLGMTHLVATRLRLPGFDPAALERSLEALAGIVR
jgi:alkanesulfonate monooxygenase SsuD/methylene tetrahydromethanopterin reductase-like flavin-dependent oxidoreductase (luciferase family)